MRSVRGRFSAVAWILILYGASLHLATAAESAAGATQEEDTNSTAVLRSYLQLQEQLHATQLLIEQNQREATLTAARTAEALDTRLEAIESALAAQRARELDATQSANRSMVVVAGIFATVGFGAMLLMAYFQWRTIRSLADVTANFSPRGSLGPAPAVAALGFDENSVPPAAGSAVESSQRLLGALDQLEKRIHQIEHTARPVASAPETLQVAAGASGSNGKGEAQTSEPKSEPAMLEKAQSLLDAGKPEAALDCLQELLAIDPDNTEALVKKGAALERLQKFDEAVQCYDRAIALNGSMTIAYLAKGGVFNRMERFSEALACYEQALHTQEKRP